MTERHEEPRPADEQRAIQLLLVEDIPDHAELISAVIRGGIATIRIRAAATAEAALDLATNERFDILLTDYRIGPVECFELIDRLRARDVRMPTIVLTGQGNELVAAEAIGEGVEDYLIKDVVFRNPEQLIRSIRNAVEKNRLQHALRESEELYRTLVQNIQEGVFVMRESRLVYFNPSLCRILETHEDLISGLDFFELFVLEHRERVKRFIADVWSTGQTDESEFIMIGTEAKPRIYVGITVSRCSYQGEPAIIGTVKDITARVLAQQKLKEMLEEKERLSITDDLTRLRNRRHVLEQLEAEINRSRRYSSPLSLIMLDVDRFKEINDLYGHLFGDEALVTIADILRGELRDTDTVARYGGDEFMILLPETDLKQARTLADRVLNLVSGRSLQLSPDNPKPLTVSIGIAELQAENDTSKTLIHRADEGLLAAKAAGRNTVIAVDADSSLLSFD